MVSGAEEEAAGASAAEGGGVVAVTRTAAGGGGARMCDELRAEDTTRDPHSETHHGDGAVQVRH